MDMKHGCLPKLSIQNMISIILLYNRTYNDITGGVLELRSLLSRSVNPPINEFPPHTITLLYKLYDRRQKSSVSI